jgi:hypothetical protein
MKRNIKKENCLTQIVVRLWLKLKPGARPISQKIPSHYERIEFLLLAIKCGIGLLLFLSGMHVITIDPLIVNLIELIIPIAELLVWLLRFI